MKKQNKRGQAMVEYIIIVVLVAIAALAVFAAFSDTIRNKLAGGIQEMDNNQGAADAKAALGKSQDYLKNLDGSK